MAGDPWAADPRGHMVEVQCPYCFEPVEVLIDADTEGELVQDCEVCCNPWQLTVRRHGGAAPEVTVEAI